MYWELELQISSWAQAVSGILTVLKDVAPCYLPHPQTSICLAFYPPTRTNFCALHTAIKECILLQCPAWKRLYQSLSCDIQLFSLIQALQRQPVCL